MSGADDLIAAGPGADISDDTEEGKPLGFPKGYSRTSMTGRGQYAETGNPFVNTIAMEEAVWTPLYFSGDERGLAHGWAEERIAEVQLLMREVGLYGKTSFRLGRWDDNSVKAFKKLLEYANTVQMPWDRALQRYGAEGAVEIDGETGELVDGSPAARVKTNPADIRRIADVTARGVIGRKLRPDELDRYVAAYHSLQEQATTVAPPAVDSFAEETVRAENPEEAQEMDTLGLRNAFFDLLAEA